MSFENCRNGANALAVITAGAFGGANLFIGLSMGMYWLRLPPADFSMQFFPQFYNFLYTIMPLFLLMLVGLIMSARLDWGKPVARRNWVIALWLYLAVTLVTVFYHMPLNVRLADAARSPLANILSFYTGIALVGPVTDDNAGTIRMAWLLGHIPRIMITIAMPIFVLRAVTARR